jgi:phage terminase large subunit
MCEPNLTLSTAAEKINKLTREDEKVLYTAASPDLWNRRQDSGVSGVEIMTSAGFQGLYKADNRRIPGWRNMREYLKETENGARLYIFENCLTLIKSIPALIHDQKNVEDADDEPHEMTHAPEALRYALMTKPITLKPKAELQGRYTKTEIEDLKEKSMRIRRR